MDHARDRRRFLLGGMASAAALAAPDLRGLLGSKIPAPLRPLVPQEAFEAAGLVGELIKLEQEARALRLPASLLDFREGQVQVDPEELYQTAMPRLVALIDRSERKAPTLAEKAGGLLARLHGSEHGTPAFWLGGADVAAILPDPLEAAQEAPPGLPLPAVQVPEPLPALPPVSTSLKFDVLADEYAAWFASARVRDEFRENADWHLTMMRQSRPRYERLGQRFGVPWPFVAAIHGLEASFNFRAHLHNGDFPLSQRTRQVPAGRPTRWLPPSDWESSAADALRLLGFVGQTDWSVPRMLHRLEAYNGFGYRRAGRASPYLWAFSTHYTRGKYVADGRFDPNARSRQCGGAVMLKLLDLAGELG